MFFAWYVRHTTLKEVKDDRDLIKNCLDIFALKYIPLTFEGNFTWCYFIA